MPHRAAVLFLVLLLAVPAGAQDAPDSGTPTGVLTRPPAILKQVEASFPPEAQAQGLAGTVVMEVDIGADGKVLEARVVQPAGHGFDEAALEAVRQFEFYPRGGGRAPAPVRIQYASSSSTGPRWWRRRPRRRRRPVNFCGVVLERGTRNPLDGAQVVVEPGARCARPSPARTAASSSRACPRAPCR